MQGRMLQLRARPQEQQPAQTTSLQRSFWQAITVGELETVQVLLKCRGKEVDINRVDELGEQRQGCTALHLAILEMPTWKGNHQQPQQPQPQQHLLLPGGIQSAEFVTRFFQTLLDQGADMFKPCEYNGEWYLQTAAGKTRSFYPEGYDALGLVLQFIEITRGTDVINVNVTKRLELIRDLLLRHIKRQAHGASHGKRRSMTTAVATTSLQQDLIRAFDLGINTDVELVCHSQAVSAHKVVLAARSPVFQIMFRQGEGAFLEATLFPCRVEIEQASVAALTAFVRFLYVDELPSALEYDLAKELVLLGNRYQVAPLVSQCSQGIQSRFLSVRTCAEVLTLANDHNAGELRLATLRFMAKPSHLALVTKTAEFKALDSSLMQEVLQCVAGKWAGEYASEEDEDEGGDNQDDDGEEDEDEDFGAMFQPEKRLRGDEPPPGEEEEEA